MDTRYLRVLLLLLLFLADGCFATKNAAEGVDDGQTQSGEDLQTQAAIDWVLTANFAAEVNKQLENTTGTLAALYTPFDGIALEDALLNPDCPVAQSAEYITNETKIYEFMCCHVRKIRAPAMARVIQLLAQFFYGAPVDVVGSVPEQVLLNIASFLENDRVGIRSQYCKDDIRIHAPEYVLWRSQMTNIVLGQIQQAYTMTASMAGSLKSCQTLPIGDTQCETDADATFAVASANVAFARVDARLQSFCGHAVLAAFEAYRLDPNCPPSSRRKSQFVPLGEAWRRSMLGIV